MTRMPFGLKNAPGQFMRIMHMVFEGMSAFVVVYIDDVLIFTKEPDFHIHLEHVRKVLERLSYYGFKLSPKKCFFAQHKVEFLGHEITLEGYKPCEKNLEPIKNFPRPHNLRSVRSFVGMASYFRRYIENFSALAKPLTALTGKDVPFEWKEPQEQASLPNTQTKAFEATNTCKSGLQQTISPFCRCFTKLNGRSTNAGIPLADRSNKTKNFI